MKMMTNNWVKKQQILGAPSMHCLQQSAKIAADDKNPLRYTFLDVYQDRLRTRITSGVEQNGFKAKFSADVLDFYDNVVGKILVEIDTAFGIGLYSYAD